MNGANSRLALQFLGAARHVTGTKRPFAVGKDKALLDCGVAQGPRKVANEQNSNLPIAGRDVAGFRSVTVPSNRDRITSD